MKSITFRPLRMNKKLGKIIVASYLQWYKLTCADYNKFILIVNDDYKKFHKDEFVYNHKGELLYFFDYHPSNVPVFQWSKLFDLDEIRSNNKQYGILWDYNDKVNYTMKGTDCVGTPTFSYFTQEYVSEYYCNSVGGFPEMIHDFNPLTVSTVIKWFGWFIYQLENYRLAK